MKRRSTTNIDDEPAVEAPTVTQDSGVFESAFTELNGALEE